MAQKSTEPLPARRGGYTPRYDWDNWTDGDVWVLTRDDVFEGKFQQFRTVAYNKATLLGMRARTRIENDKLYIQFYRDDS